MLQQVETHRVSRAASIPPVSADLDPDQRSVVAANARTVRILAPAGAGKTHCMVNRVVAALRGGMAPGRILLLTFDRNAKGELKTRLDRMLGPRGAPAVFTLNAFGAKLLERFGPQSATRSLLSGQRAYAAMRSIVDAHRRTPGGRAVMPDGVGPKAYLELVSLLKSHLCYADPDCADDVATTVAFALGGLPAEVHDVFYAKLDDDGPAQQMHRAQLLVEVVTSIFIEYEEAKRRTHAIDFDDQKLDAYRLLDANDEARSKVQENYHLVIVDEFQDVNELDFQFILQIAEQATLVVVGDDDQAIYGFRATSPRYIMEFEQRSHRPTHTVVLRRNYRCPANVVRHAAALIAHNRERVEKHPIPARSETCEIRVYNPPTVDAEAAAIATWIERIIDRARPETLREIAVIYRYNTQSLPIQLELIAHEIPYYCRAEDNLSSQKVLGRLLAVLKYVVAVRFGARPEIDDFVTAVTAFYPRLDDRGQRELARAARRVPAPYFDALVQNSGVRIPGGRTFRDLIHQLADEPSAANAVASIASEFRGVQGLTGGLDDALDGKLALGELSRIAGRYASVHEFTDFLANAVACAARLGSESMDSPRVRLLTYFRSKGQQFGTVILPTLNAGQVPSRRAPEEDERRLFYVGVTRATQNLWLSYVDEICKFAAKPSTFLTELQLPASAFVTAPAARVRAPELMESAFLDENDGLPF